MVSKRRLSSLGGVVELDDLSCVDAMVTIHDVPFVERLKSSNS